MLPERSKEGWDCNPALTFSESFLPIGPIGFFFKPIVNFVLFRLKNILVRKSKQESPSFHTSKILGPFQVILFILANYFWYSKSSQYEFALFFFFFEDLKNYVVLIRSLLFH